MLKKEGKITDAVIENMLSWRHISKDISMRFPVKDRPDFDGELIN